MAAGDEEVLTGDPARILGGKKDCNGTDVVGLTDAAQRTSSGPFYLPIRFHQFLALLNGLAIDIVAKTRFRVNT